MACACERRQAKPHATAQHQPCAVRQAHCTRGRSSHVCAALTPHVNDVAVAYLAANPALGDVAEGLETPVQVLYLGVLFTMLAGGAWLVVRQVLTSRNMDERTKELGELIRAGNAVSEDYFELGVVLTRKKLFTQALQNYLKAVKLWEGEDSDLAEVHNAMGYCYVNMDKVKEAIREYSKATQHKPGYVTAWNNLADAYRKGQQLKDAQSAYETAYELDPANETAKSGVEMMRQEIGSGRSRVPS